MLGYIRNDGKRFHVYVANRVQRIRNTSSSNQWHYVPTANNPADHASRGLTASKLITSNWLSGPDFLWQDEIIIENDHQPELSPNDVEVRHVNARITTLAEPQSMLKHLERFSNWSRVITGIARIQEFLQRSMKLPQHSSPEENRKKAERTVLMMMQKEAFKDEIHNLKSEKQGVTAQSTLFKLDPFIDDDGIMRVGGRLAQAQSLNPEVKHPIILPKKSHMTTVIIRYHHERVAHQGRGMTVNKIRSNGYWIPNISSAVSSYIHKCVTCRKHRGQTQTQKMANLPVERLEPAPPFSYCGYDCFGPFIVKDGRKEQKRYGVLFTCMACRAVHIEMVNDMTTDAFINALRCFIALRGKVRQLRSDQGTNFIGAHNELAKAMNEMDDQKIESYLAKQGCDFVTNIPSASHMGGVWERQIRTIRSALNGIMNEYPSRLDSSSLRTLFYEAMSIVNSRPLTVENLNDPFGPEALTPNHLLTMKTEISLPPPGEFVRNDVYTRKRWRRVQYLANMFWERWKKEYLQLLQVRPKWSQPQRNIEVGDIVLLKEDQLIRGQLRLAKVVDVLPSRDNLVRKVRLLLADPQNRTKNYIERPIHKLILLLEGT